MKKVLSAILVMSMILVIGAPCFARDGYMQDITYFDSTKRCVVSGYLRDAAKNLTEVSISLMDGDNVVYADSTDIDAFGNYEFVFEYDGDMDNLTLNLRRGGEIVNDSVKNAISFSKAIEPKFTISKSGDDDCLTATVYLENKYGVKSGYNVIFAYYNEAGSLNGTTVFDGSTVDSQNEAKEIEEGKYIVRVPADTAKIKAFAWNDLKNIMPIAKSAEDSDINTFSKDERIALIGASLQAGVGATMKNGKLMQNQTWLEYLLKMRYPEYNIQVENRAISGDAPSSNSIERLAWDTFSLTSQFGTDENFRNTASELGFDYKNLTPRQALYMSMIASFGSKEAADTAMGEYTYETIPYVAAEQLLADNEDAGNVSKYANGETLALLAGKTPEHIIVTWGTNAIGYSDRNKEDTLTEQAKTLVRRNFEWYKNHVVTMLKQPGVKTVTICSLFATRLGEGDKPGPMYTEEYYADLLEDWVKSAKKSGTLTYGEGEIYVLGEDQRVNFVNVLDDFFELYEKHPVARTSFMGDLVHANTYSHMFGALHILNELGVSPYVAKTVINASNSQTEGYNAEVKNLSIEGENITYTYSPKSYPMAVDNDGWYQYVSQFENIDGIINTEEIQVKGLTGDKYNLYLDGTIAGTYSKEELENGINIACLAQNPNQIKSKEMFEIYMENASASSNFRRIYANIGGMNGTVNVGLQGGIQKLKSIPGSGFDYYELAEKITGNRNTLKTYGLPESYQVELVPVEGVE